MANPSRDLLDDDGENRALRSFLMQYSCDRAVTIDQMREHMDMCGWAGLWPEFVAKAGSREHLTKAGAQLWIRHLFDLERATPPSSSTAPEVPPIPESLGLSDVPHAMNTPDEWDADYRATWQKLQVADANLSKMRAYARQLRSLASRPAEVDDGRLPELPLESARASKGQGAFFMKWSETGKDLRGELLLFTAEQFRQGQRDAVAADRARRDALLIECKRFLEDMHAMPIEWTIKESQVLHQKLSAPSHTTNKEK